MAKKKSKNIQKLLKKKQIQQLQESSFQDLPAIEAVEKKPELAEKPKRLALIPASGKPIAKTLISTGVLACLIFAVAFWSGSAQYLDSFGTWLYETLRLDTTN